MKTKFTFLFGLPAVLALTACSGEEKPPAPAPTATATQDDNYADAMRSDKADPKAQIPDSEVRPIMQAQVMLDRLGFSSGVIDGEMGMSTANALKGFQQARGLPETGKLDDATMQALAANDIPATRVVTIPEEFAIGRFEKIPANPAEQAKMQRLGYESLDEKLAERFHTTIETLKMLNPGGKPAAPGVETPPTTSISPKPVDSQSAVPVNGATPGPDSNFHAGQQIRVPNIGSDFIDANADIDRTWRDTLRNLGVGSEQPHADRIVVDKSEGTLKAFGKDDKLIAAFTVTTGSSHDPLPIGDWKVLGVAHNPPFFYDPDLFWDVPDNHADHELPPGPNGPVGVVWIDLSKEHYGIHGTPHPETIGRAQSHGCVRLTNWDAARLAQMVNASTKVVFQR